MPHTLGPSDYWCVALGRKDPLTREKFKTGDEVIVCASCKTVSLKISWDYDIANNIGGCCVCGGSQEHNGFERSYIDYAHTHPILKISSGKSSARSKAKKHRAIGTTDQTQRIYLTAKILAGLFCVALAVYIIFFGGWLLLQQFLSDLAEKWRELTQVVSSKVASINISSIWESFDDWFAETIRQITDIF